MSAHETFLKDENVKGSSDRAFGIVFTIVFAIVGLWPLRHALPVRYWALGIGLTFLAAALVYPAGLRPLNRLWTWFGLQLQKLTNPIVMAILFFTVITPVAIVLKILRKDLLKRKFDKAAPSYWVERPAAAPASETMRNQF